MCAKLILVDLLDFKMFSLNLDIGVDVRGPETDFTIKKDWKSGHQMMNISFSRLRMTMTNSSWRFIIFA